LAPTYINEIRRFCFNFFGMQNGGAKPPLQRSASANPKFTFYLFWFN
jgi:hypothetical protein